jgi:AAA domain/Primase C terminal 2 (PriCT-2)
VRGEGGMVLAPPSVKVPVGAYSIVSNADIADAPDWLVDLAVAAGNSGGSIEREPNDELEAPLALVEAAVSVIANNDIDWEDWNNHGMAIFGATGGSNDGFVLFDKFSKKSKAKYNAARTFDKWRSYHSSPPNRIGFGSLHHWACEADPDWYRVFEAQGIADFHAAAMDPEMQGLGASDLPIVGKSNRPTEEAANNEIVADLSEARANGNGSNAKVGTKDDTKQEQQQQQEQPSDLHIVRVADVEAKAYNWMWKSRIARGKVTLLVGMPDVNKSTLALDLTSRITRGDVLPNNEGRAPLGNVIILSAEDDVADTIRPRLEVAGADLDRVHAITAVKLKKNGRRTFDLTQDIERLYHSVASAWFGDTPCAPLRRWLGRKTPLVPQSSQAG